MAKIKRKSRIVAADDDFDFDTDLDPEESSGFGDDEMVEDDDGFNDTLDDIADDIEDLQDDLDDTDQDEEGNGIELENNIDGHYIAECSKCHGIFISAVSESSQKVSSIQGVCPLCDKESEQFLNWVIKKVD